MAPNVTAIELENLTFTPTVTPPNSNKTLILAGAGLRDGERDGKYMKFSVVGIYLEESAVPYLAAKWKGKTAEELEKSEEFLNDLAHGPYEKLVYVKVLGPLFGEKWSVVQAKLFTDLWKSLGVYTDAEAKALDQLHEVMKPEVFQPGYAILSTISAEGVYTFSFTKDGSLPKVGNVVINNRLLANEVLSANIGTIGCVHNARKSVVSRLAEWFNKTTDGKVAVNGK